MVLQSDVRLRFFDFGNLNKEADPLVGAAVAGRFHITSMVHQDDFSTLYVGMDISEQSRIGVRIARNHKSHIKMLEWLSRAMLSTLGKQAILAIGHFEKDQIMYVVLSEAALDIVRLPQASAPNT